ncbi:outer membrane transport energization protein TonB [Luteibacter rhizovicinus]|uniref:Outer membrane transport energization protein TonB n=1 Tax=Luteibacter rhizovicinus TaxID=242606 RepID=A0A4V2W4H1_9GAMM|nr:energy transducer TonB [Luteibacter rhizovicinus]TCV95889.1 outer membrane transport energization protein TonB [Luteibacter rhizovicinus]
MSSARPQFLAEVHPDTVRIVAMSAAIALNAAVLLAAMRPMAADISLIEVAKPFAIAWHEPPPVAPIPPPIDLKPIPATPHAPTAAATPHPTPAPVAVSTPTDEGTIAPVPVTPSIAPPTDAAPVTAAPLAGVTLAYVSAPAPAYPTIAVRRHLSGTVVLRVLVDESGKPIDVVVESSSGHDVLDKAAREQVLAKWTFQPAQTNGQHVKAWARVPVTFDLRSL